MNRLELGVQVTGEMIRGLGNVVTHKLLDEPPEMVDRAVTRVREVAACMIDATMYPVVERLRDNEIKNGPDREGGE